MVTLGATGTLPEPTPAGAGTAAREQANPAPTIAKVNRPPELNLCQRVPLRSTTLTRNLIVIVATSARLQDDSTAPERAVVFPAASSRDPAIQIER